MIEVAQPQRCVTAARAPGPVPLCGDAASGPWSLAEPIQIDRYPWYKDGLKQATEVRLLHDETAVYVQFLCQDVHSFARVRELNGMVCRDSCVEFFATVDPQAAGDYFNLEINCCGVFLLGFGSGRHGRKQIDPALAGRISVATSVSGPAKEESDDDRHWWAAAAVPLDVLGELASRSVELVEGGWRANFYRCGGKSDPQYACWNEIDLPSPDFHCSQFFGSLAFA